jgi:hypothetical protein
MRITALLPRGGGGEHAAPARHRGRLATARGGRAGGDRRLRLRCLGELEPVGRRLGRGARRRGRGATQRLAVGAGRIEPVQDRRALGARQVARHRHRVRVVGIEAEREPQQLAVGTNGLVAAHV